MGRARRRRKTKIRHIKITFLVILVIMAIILIRTTNARYKSTGQSDANVDLAFYLLREQSISQDLKLSSILPRQQPYNYTFSVANNDGTYRTETAIQYTITLKTTTNLPLSYAVYAQGDTTTNLITNINTTQDSDGTYFKNINVTGGNLGFATNEQNTYVLQVTFPAAYNSAEYEGIIEYVQVTINSSQRLS